MRSCAPLPPMRLCRGKLVMDSRRWNASLAACLLVLVLGLILPTPPVLGAPLSGEEELVHYIVTTSDDTIPDGAVGSLRWAINEANRTMSSAMITFAPDVTNIPLYFGTLNIADFSSLTINGPGVTVRGTTQRPGTNFTIGTQANVMINGLRIELGRNTTGGNGGGIVVGEGAQLTLNQVTLVSNMSIGNGAGIYVGTGGRLSLNQSVLRDNRALGGSGGGIYVESGGQVFVEGSQIDDNLGIFGAGIYMSAGSQLNVESSNITANVGRTGGAGSIHVESSEVRIANSVLAGNIGGALSLMSGSAQLVNTTVAQDIGNEGSLLVYGGVLSVINSTVVDNRRGIFVEPPGHLILHNSIVAGQNSTSDIAGSSGVCTFLFDIRHSLVEDGSCITSGVNGNISGSPQLGGEFDGYAPLSGSPVTDAGFDLWFPGDISSATDRVGNPRRMGSQVDMGAIESGTPEPGEAPPRVTLHAGPRSVAEGDTTTVRITRGNRTDGNLAVSLRITSAGASTDDYTLTGAPINGQTGDVIVSILDGQSSVTFTLTAIDDDLPELDESLTFEVLPLTGYELGDSTTATFTILRSDMPEVAIEADDDTVAEGDSTTIVVSRTGDLTSALETLLIIAGVSEADYSLSGEAVIAQAGSAIVTIPAGEASVTLTLEALVDNACAEGDEALIVTVLPTDEYDPGEPSDATITIPRNGTIVCSGEDSGEGTLRQAIENANEFAGDQVITFEGVSLVTLTSGELAITGPGALTIEGAGVTVQRAGVDIPEFGVFYLDFGVNATVNGLTITGGSGEHSGGINVSHANLTVNGVTIAGNDAWEGGGIAASGSSYYSTSLTINNSTISGNTASYGGGIWVAGATLTVNGSTIAGNSATYSGGGIESRVGSATEATVEIWNSTLRDNSGGALWHSGWGSATLVNSIISGNTAALNTPYALYAGGEMHVINSTVAYNTGGVYVDGGALYLHNSIIAFSEGNDCDIFEGTLDIRYSLVQDGPLCYHPDTGGDHSDTGFEGVDPMFVPGGGYALQEGSPAIDAGSDTLFPGDISSATDHSGNPRRQGERVDMGAVESSYGAPPPLTISISDASVEEPDAATGSTELQFTVELSAPAPAGGVTFDIATGDGTATAGVDYEEKSLTGQVIPEGEAAYTFSVAVLFDDVPYEPDETFLVNLTNVTGATVDRGQAIGTILNDDPLPPMFTIWVSAAEASVETGTEIEEGDSGTTEVSFTVGLSAPVPANGIVFSLRTEDGTAIAGEDYVAFTAEDVVFPTALQSYTFTVLINGDTDFEPDETFFVELYGVALEESIEEFTELQIDNHTVEVTILNDDDDEEDTTPPVVTITGPVASGGATTTLPIPITISFSEPVQPFTADEVTVAGGVITSGSFGSHASEPNTYVFTVEPTTSNALVVSVAEDAVQDLAGNPNAETAYAVNFIPTVHISAVNPIGDVTEGTDVIFTITRNGSLAGALEGDLSVTGATSDMLVPSSYSIPASSASADVTIDTTDNDTVDATRTVGVALVGVPGALELGTPASISVNVLDNDAPPLPTLSINNVSQNEGNSGTANFTFVVTLSAASASVVTVDVSTSNGTAAAGVDYTAINTMLTFAPGEVSKAVNVEVYGDSTFEADETFFVNLSNPTNATIAVAQGIGTILNDDDSSAEPPDPTETPTPAPVVAATYPPPPSVSTCTGLNFDPDSPVRASFPDGLAGLVGCRVLYQNGSPVTWHGADLYNAGAIGHQGVLDLGVIHAIDVASPQGVNQFPGGAVVCLRGAGALIFLAASGAPRTPVVMAQYTVAEWPGYTCTTLYETGTLVLVGWQPE